MNTPQAQAATSPTATPAPAPGADTQTPPAVAAPGSITIAQIDTDRLDLNALDTMMGSGADPGKPIALPIKVAEGVSQEGAPPVVPAVAPVVPAVVPPANPDPSVQTPPPAAATPPAVAPPAPPVPPVVVPAGEDEQLPSRFRFNDERDQKIASLRKGGMDWKEAVDFVDAQSGTAGLENAPPVDPATALQETDARIAQLEGTISGAGEDEALFGKDIAEATIELNRLSRERPLLAQAVADRQRHEQEQEQARIVTEKQSKEAAKALAIARFPDVASHDTPLGKAVAKRIAEMKDENHPDHAILFTGNAPLIVTRLIASEMGIPEVNPESPPPGSQAQPPTPVVKVASPVAGSARTAQPLNNQPKVTVETLRASESLEDLDAAFGANQQPLLQAIR